MFNNSGQKQDGKGNIQAKGNVTQTNINFFEDDVSFDLVETEKIIIELYELSQTIETKEDFTYDRIKIEDKNKQNQMEEYFSEKIEEDIVYFKEIQQVLYLNDEDFTDRFKYIIRTIRGAIIALDNKADLTPSKINKIIGQFYKQDWDFKKKLKAERLIHFMYFSCFIGKKESI
ncbi:ABC-three component system protein [Sulfurimonas sp. CS5]|uniref:ABC-three component system protein n=1 Tax=Sulfurimonas sp. CS5 TaxID=3391145 RepID=UPI0039EAB18F